MVKPTKGGKGDSERKRLLVNYGADENRKKKRDVGGVAGKGNAHVVQSCWKKGEKT